MIFRFAGEEMVTLLYHDEKAKCYFFQKTDGSLCRDYAFVLTYVFGSHFEALYG